MRSLKLFTAGLTLLALISCSENGTGPVQDDQDGQGQLPPGGFDITGVWEVIHVDGAIDPHGNPLYVDSSNGLLTFFNDGTYHFFFKAEPYYDEEVVGKYEFDADTLRWTGELTRYFHSTTILNTFKDHFEYLDRDGDLWRYRYLRPAVGTQLPVVTTAPADLITQTSARLGGKVKSHGAAGVVAYGVCWSEHSGPTIDDAALVRLFAGGRFSMTAPDLKPGTVYYARAFAESVLGLAYGSEISFTTLEKPVVDSVGTVTDIDGNVYRTVKIGDQWWMAENLKTTRYRNGDAIPNVTEDWWVGHGAYCNYNNKESSADTYGRLYNWFAVADSRGIAPEGWHVPTDVEWKELEQQLGIKNAALNVEGLRGSTQGGALKETGLDHWLLPNSSASNSTGFTALPAGQRDLTGWFKGLGRYADFWTASAKPSLAWNSAWCRRLAHDYAQINRFDYFKEAGFAVRCVKD